jgi:hypothetical protein
MKSVENSTKFPTIITCPSELVALSAALGYAQVTGSPVGIHLLLELNRTDSEAMRHCTCRLRNPSNGPIHSQCLRHPSTRPVFCGIESIHRQRGDARFQNRVS